MRVYTDVNVTLGSGAAVFAAQELGRVHLDDIEFVSGDWDGAMDQSDLAVEIYAGCRGIIGETRRDGSVDSSFGKIVARYADDLPEDYQDAWRSLVTLVDAEDARVDSGLNTLLRAYNARRAFEGRITGSARAKRVYSDMYRVFETLLGAEVARFWADRAEIVGDGNVAITHDSSSRWATLAVLFDGGVRVIVDVHAGDILVLREDSETLRLDDPAIRAVIDAAGEQLGHGYGTWSVKSDGSQLTWRATGEAGAGSRVDPRDLATAAARLLATSTER